MSLLAVFKRATNQGTEIGNLQLDATISDNHSMVNDITDHPIEEGSVVNDHIIKNPKTYTVEGTITNSPLVFLAGFRSQNTRAQDAFDELERLRDEGTLLTVISAFKTYQNMAIQSLEFPRDRNTGDALFFTCELKQITIVTPEFTTIDVDNETFQRFSDQRNLGKQSTQSPSENETRGASILAAAFGG